MTRSDWIDAIRLGWEVLGGLAMLLSAVLSLAMRAVLKQMVSKDELRQHAAEHGETHKELGEKLNDGEVRFGRIEEQLKHLPQRSDIEKLMSEIGGVTAGMRKVEAEVRGVNTAVGGLQTTVNMLVKNELEGP